MNCPCGRVCTSDLCIYIYISSSSMAEKGEAFDLGSVGRKSISVGQENAVLELRFRERTSQAWVEMLRP
jgi:hypothetical protein